MRARAALTAAVLVVSAAQALAQQPSLSGRPVASQVVTVDGRPVREPGVLDLIETRVGEPLAPADVRETIAHLVGLGRYEDVVVHASEEETGVALRYELLPTRTVARYEFRGEVGLSERLLRDQIADRVGESPRLAQIPDIVAALEQVYRDNGYLQPVITPRPDLAAPSGPTLLPIEITAGPRVRYASITVEGNAPMPLEGIAARLGLQAGQFYRRPDVEERLARFVDDLRERGYYEARADHQLEAGPDGTTGELLIHVDAGAHVSIVFEGDQLPARVRRELVPIEREGSLDEDLLEDSANRIEAYLRDEGYRDADATYERTPRGDELALVFRVTRGPEYRIGSIALDGNAQIPAADLRPLIQSREGEPLVEAALRADVARLLDHYRRRGFTEVSVEPVLLPVPGGGEPIATNLTFRIAEGTRTLVDEITIADGDAIPEPELRAALSTRTGEPYYQPQVAVDRDALLVRYLNQGYPDAAVDARVTFSPDRSRAAVRFTISEGPQVFVDHVLIVGNQRTSAATIRRELLLRPGMPLGYSDLMESQRRISALGLFRRVRITELDHGDPTRRDLLVTVEEAPATTLGYGGGLEGGQRLRREVPGGPAVEVFELAPRGFFELGRRNLFGRNQSVNLFARASLRTRASTTEIEPGEEPPSGYTLRDYRVLGTFRAPRWLGSQNDLLVTAFLEQGLRSSFNFTRRGARVEVARRISPVFSFSGRYVIERTKLSEERFAPIDQPLIDRLFPQVRLSTMSASFIRDTRDDPLGPTRGSLAALDAVTALRAIGSEVGFVKSFAQGFIYRQLPGRRGVVLAAGARLGLANGFAREVPLRDENGNPVLDPDGNPVIGRVDDLPASERFFAGGDTSVRGFALDRLGTPETIDRNGFPKGGNAVLVLNAELRIPVWRELGAVTFVDAGNVFNRIDDFAVGELRPTSGFGLRYRSPIGPLRVDLGFKLNRQTLPTGELEPRTELHISLGQAF